MVFGLANTAGLGGGEPAARNVVTAAACDGPVCRSMILFQPHLEDGNASNPTGRSLRFATVFATRFGSDIVTRKAG